LEKKIGAFLKTSQLSNRHEEREKEKKGDGEVGEGLREGD